MTVEARGRKSRNLQATSNLVAPGIATSNKGIATSSKNATRNKGALPEDGFTDRNWNLLGESLQGMFYAKVPGLGDVILHKISGYYFRLQQRDLPFRQGRLILRPLSYTNQCCTVERGNLPGTSAIPKIFNQLHNPQDLSFFDLSTSKHEPVACTSYGFHQVGSHLLGRSVVRPPGSWAVRFRSKLLDVAHWAFVVGAPHGNSQKLASCS